RGDLAPQALDRGWEAESPDIFVVKRDRADISGLDGHARRLLLDRGAQGGFVERALAQTAAKGQDGDASFLAHVPLRYDPDAVPCQGLAQPNVAGKPQAGGGPDPACAADRLVLKK